MRKILTLNNIALAGLRRLPRERYEVASEITHPDAILLRSFNMHDMLLPDSVVAVGRAGAGVNNIPVSELSRSGVAVFNAPGANANAVKELAVAALLMVARNIPQALEFSSKLSGDDAAIAKAVEAGKKQFVGFELPGKTLGVIGLGAIGVELANSAQALGMNVIGYDPKMTVERAWQLSSNVEQARSIDHLFRSSDVVSLHVPLMDATRNLVNAERVEKMPKHGIVLNLARGGIVDDAAVIAALESGQLHGYVTDFPTAETLAHPRIVALPHLGASTLEAEENCAVQVVENVRSYLENGNIRHSVNFPETMMPRIDCWRLTVANANVPNMVGQISTVLADAGLNISDLLNKSRGDIAYTLVDLDGDMPAETADRIQAIKGVLKVRSLGRPARD